MSWLLPPLPPTFDAALRDVKARGFEARLAAAERLAQPDEGRWDEARDALFTMSRDRDARIRAAALLGLAGQSEDAAVVDLLIDALGDGDALVREVAIARLGAAPGKRARQAVVEALRSQHAEVRFQAIESYFESCDAPSLKAIEPLLSDSDARVRENAALVIERLGPAAIPALTSTLQDPRPSVRHRAAISLARLGETPALPMLRDALLDPDLSIAALELLVDANDRESAERIAMIAQNFFRPPAWRAAAARALHRLGDPRGVEVLVALMRAFRNHGRNDAVQAVGELGLHHLGAELLALAQRPRGTDPATLVTALGALHSESYEARRGLDHMAQRADEAGEQAQAILAQPSADERD